jgi:hypothetical protein
MTTHHGSCHCGAVRFAIDTEVDIVSICDCSLCTKKGIVHVPVPESAFRLLAGAAELVLYRFGSRTASHWFCRHCGIHAFGRPRTDPGRYTVNARCLDEYDAVMARAHAPLRRQESPGGSGRLRP